MALQRVPVRIVIGGALAVGGGAAAGISGVAQMQRAKRDNRARAERYAARHLAHEEAVLLTNQALQALGRNQERAQREVIYRMRDFLELQAKQVLAHEHLILDGVDGTNTRVVGMAKLDADVAGWVRGIVTAVSAGQATPGIVKAGVIKMASASTGTPIASLHGAAAEKATLAFLGGGSLKAGGGGIKLGRYMLNIATVSPTVLIFGLTVLGKGFKAKTGAEEFRTKVEIEIARLDVRDELLRGVQLRTEELDDILVRLIIEATEALDLLESEEFVMAEHAKRLQAALVLQRAVRDVATAPIANEHGELDESTDALIFKYRKRNTETLDD